MPTTYEILGQISPAANTLTNVYVTPASTNAIVSTITIHNHIDANASYSLFVRPINEAANDKHFIIRGGVIPTRELISITGAVTMNGDCILACNTSKSGITFNAYGAKVVPAE